MECPQDGQFVINSLKHSEDHNLPEFHGIIESVELLGHEATLGWQITLSGLEVEGPKYFSTLPVVLKITIK